MITFDTFYTIQRVSGLSQDDKPMGMKPGSIFMELDTGKKFIFDGEDWHEQPQGGGGLPAELESVTEYVQETDWVDDTYGTALYFAKTYCNFDDETDRKLYVAYITENGATLYGANYLMIQRNGAGASAYIGHSVRDNWTSSGGITSGRSFRITAGAKIKVFAFKFGGNA